MPDIHYDESKEAWVYRQKLRSPYIDYNHGWFFITFQVAGNKSALGAVVGEECILNELGQAIHDAWLSEPEHVGGLRLFDFQVMPNHFHALLYYRAVGTVADGMQTAPGGSPATAPGTCGLLPRHLVGPKYERDANARDLAYVIGLFKSWTTTLYHRLKAKGRCIDIGPKLWQDSFYDELIRSDLQFTQTAAYIRNNPANWNLDRFGPVTSFTEGNQDLLKSEYVAYLSSEGFDPNLLPGKTPMKKLAVGAVADGLHSESAPGGSPATAPGGSSATAPGGSSATAPSGSSATAPSGSPATAPGGSPATAPGTRRPIISTFTSFYERQILERCLRDNRRFIWVCPGGISETIRAKAADAIASGCALLISPVAPNTGVNKQRANWCNQFIAKNAAEIWLGHLRPGGSLESILKGCGK